MIEANMKYGLLLFPAALLLVWSCRNGQDKDLRTADRRLDFTVNPGHRVGLITPDSCSRDQVLFMYGDQARVDSIYLVEGLAGEGVVLFADDPAKRAELYWDPELDPQRPAFIRITGDENGHSDWKTEQGITIGSTLAEVEVLNGSPFRLFGFGWDYGGLVTDWNGGAFDLSLGLRFGLDHKGEFPNELAGEVELSSDNPLLRDYKVVVSTMELNVGRPIDHLQALQGVWQSLADPTYQLVIDGYQIQHFNTGELTLTTTIEIDTPCTSVPCQGSGNPPAGWCFLEKGEFDVQCNLVLTSDTQSLEYTALGSTGAPLRFKKVE